MAEQFMAEQAAQRPLTSEEAEQLRIRHKNIRARAEQLLGRQALAHTEASSVHPAGNAPARCYEHHWRVPVQIGREGAWKVKNEPATMYAQIGACTLKEGTEVEYYEVQAYGVPQDMRPGKGPRWPFAPRFGDTAVLPAELPGKLLQLDANQVDAFGASLSDLERAAPAN